MLCNAAAGLLDGVVSIGLSTALGCSGAEVDADALMMPAELASGTSSCQLP